MEVDSLGNVAGETKNEPSLSQILINDLPIEILANIFSRLEPLELCNAQVVCKRWKIAILNRHTWAQSFTQRFGLKSVFPSVSGSSLWMTEYFTRLQVYKKWRRAKARHTSYQVLNHHVVAMIGHCLADFNLDRLLSFSMGDIAICNLHDGKNVTYVPGNLAFFNISAYSVNWDYLLLGKETGELYLKNLKTSTSSTTSRTSLTTIIDENEDPDPITCTALNFYWDKYRKDIDCIAGSLLGSVKFWTIGGALVHTLKLDEPLIEVKSDFRTVAVALTLKRVCIIDFKTFKTSLIDLHVSFEERERYRLFMDVDFADSNVIISYKDSITVFNYEYNTTSSVQIPSGLTVMKGQMQAMPRRMVHKRDPSLAGSDGLLYANILSDDSVIVWNVRGTTSNIVPQCIINPVFKFLMGAAFSENQVNAVALNSSVVAIGGYNGYTNLYNVSTGQFIRYCSISFPKKFDHFYRRLYPVSEIILNEDQSDAQGAIVCMDSVQFFSFGEEQNKTSSGSKKKLNVGPTNKQFVKRSIRDAIEDYDHQQNVQKHEEELIDKFNGTEYDEDEELSVALAISQSLQLVEDSNKSTTESPTEGSSSAIDEDEQLRLALEKSLYDI